MSSIRRQQGFTTIELLIALFISTVGIMSLISTLDMSRRLTTLSEMKEAAAHIGEQKMEELRALDYDEIALDSAPAVSTDPNNPGYYVTGGAAAAYRWNQKANAPTPHTESLLICPAVSDACPEVGAVPAAAEPWSDEGGRISGEIYRYVTTVDDASCGATACPEAADYKRITLAVTVDQASGPEKPILFSALISDPDTAPTGEVVDGGENPLSAPTTQCTRDGVLVDCVNSLEGSVSSFYLYDTPATSNVREEISGHHTTHPTIAPVGVCDLLSIAGCPTPDLMGSEPPPSPTVTPPLYKYSSEITGGTWPGGAVIRRDTSCHDEPTLIDNTKGHLWVSAPLAAPMTLTGDAALTLSTSTFNAVSAAVTICVRFYNVPPSLLNLINAPPTAIGTDSYASSTWPATPTKLAFTMDFRAGEQDYTIPAGNRLGVRIWITASSTADIAALYDHPLHKSFIQVNQAN